MQQNYLSERQIRTIFGIKIRQLRTDHDLSLFGLAKLTGLSKSYLNEIEKGKKYPKTDKIVLLAQALEVSYEELVSLEVSGKMSPLSNLIKSGVMKEIPLHLFGIDEGGLIDLVANAPEKVTSFMATLFEMAHRHNITREQFFLSALMNYQQLNNNYFPELEKEARKFSKRYQLDIAQKLKSRDLEEILRDEFGYVIDYEELIEEEFPEAIRSVFIPKDKKILIAHSVSETQRVFILAKELGYAHLGIEQRPLTFSWIKFEHFDDVLNNFKASYFAGALILPEKRLNEDIKVFFAKKKWSPKAFLKLMLSYTDSAETFFQRLTNLLPEHHGIKDVFFQRLSQVEGDYSVKMSKELHLGSEKHFQFANGPEHFCRRWASVRVLLEQEDFTEKSGVRIGAQLSTYKNSKSPFLIIAASNMDPFQKDRKRSVCVGLNLSGRMAGKIGFAKDSNVPSQRIGLTCERCNIEGCEQRASKPTLYNEKLRERRIKERVDSLVFNTGK